MKRIVLITALVLLISTAAAVVGGPEPSDGELAITSSGSSASATSTVESNGTKWSSSIKMKDRISNISEGEILKNVSLSDSKASFTGYIQAPTPCHVIDQETQKIDNSSYLMNIETVKENESRICTQQIVMIEYIGSFEAEAPYSLEIRHNSQTIDTLEKTVGGEGTEDDKEGVIQTFLSWLENLF